MIHRTASSRLAWIALLLPLACAAQERGLTLGEALERNLSGPGIAAQAAETEAIEARAARDALAPPFTAGVEVENFAGNGALQGMDDAEVTLRLGRLIELGGKREARTKLGDAEIARQRNLGSMARQETSAMTRLRFVEVLADQRRLQVAREHVRLTSRARDEVARVVNSARNPETDLHSAEIALADAELELEHAEHELAAARVTLASSWRAREPDFSEALGDLDELPEPETLAALASRLDQSPLQQDAALQLDVLAARRQVVRASAAPDLSATLGVRRLEGLDEQALVMSLSLPLGSRSRAALDLREVESLNASRIHQRAAASADLHQLLFEKYQELLHARSEFMFVRDRMHPAAEKSLQLAQRGFNAGRFSYQVLAQSQDRWIELQRRRIDAAARYHALLAGIELLGATTSGVSP